MLEAFEDATVLTDEERPRAAPQVHDVAVEGVAEPHRGLAKDLAAARGDEGTGRRLEEGPALGALSNVATVEVDAAVALSEAVVAPTD